MKNYPKRLIIIPTYNEAENIARLIEEIFQLHYDFEVLVIDDNSSDGTAEIVRKLSVKRDKIFLIQRPSKLGYGSAIIEGFKFALNQKVDVVIEMDADFSHNPLYLKEFLHNINRYQVVIGSRYIKGGRVVNWPFKRRALSYLANIYVRLITGMAIHDATSGYRCYRREVLERIDFKAIKSEGYAFLIEMCFIYRQKEISIGEIPIVFVERKKGTSKISKRIIIEAFFLVLKLGWNRLRHSWSIKD